MFSKTGWLNIFLAGMVFFLGFQTYTLWTEKENRMSTSQETPASESDYPEKRFFRKDMPRESAYNVMVEKNLFSPDRAEYIPPEEPKDPEPEVKPVNILGQKITLYGVIIMDGYKKALINNPVRQPDERENKWVKEGDTVGDLTVTGIQRESILLAEGEKKYEILLYDSKKPVSSGGSIREEAKTTPTVVISETTQKVSQPSGAKESKASGAGKSAEPEFEYINTPFGKVKRRKN